MAKAPNGSISVHPMGGEVEMRVETRFGTRRFYLDPGTAVKLAQQLTAAASSVAGGEREPARRG